MSASRQERRRFEVVLGIDVVVEKDKEEFHTYCPALKGLHSSGETVGQAYSNGEDAVMAHLKSMLGPNTRVTTFRREMEVFDDALSKVAYLWANGLPCPVDTPCKSYCPSCISAWAKGEARELIRKREEGRPWWTEKRS